MAIAFEHKPEYTFGKIAETQIACWLRQRGWSILPIYEKESDDNKGPRLFAPDNEFIAPDMLAMKGATMIWVEAKHKTVFSWRGVEECWETGIDLRHYEEYQQIYARHLWPVWVMFLHNSDRTDPRDVERWDAPAKCPTGLFGGPISHLMKHESHRDTRWGRSGMVYWRHETLRQLATLDELSAAAQAPDSQGMDTLRTIAGRGRG